MEEIRNAYGHTTSEVIAMQRRCYSLKDVMNGLVNDVNKLNKEIEEYKEFINQLNSIIGNIGDVTGKVESGYSSFMGGGYVDQGQDASRGKLTEASGKLAEQISSVDSCISKAEEKMNEKIKQRDEKIKQYQEKDNEKQSIKNSWGEPEIHAILNSILALQMA